MSKSQSAVISRIGYKGVIFYRHNQSGDRWSIDDRFVSRGEGKMSGRQGLICIRSAALMIARSVVAGICMVALKACGGGGGSSSDSIPPNTPPTFGQSLYTLSVVEGAALSVSSQQPTLKLTILFTV